MQELPPIATPPAQRQPPKRPPRRWRWLRLGGLGVAGAAVIVAWVVVPDQLAQRRQAAAEAAQEARLIDACHIEVSFRARYRSRVRFTESGYLPHGDGATVVGMVDMLNGL
ncbi:MAG TPA: hypothetical protein VHN38_06355, partial [Immundisolibacter sp.]|nr:hypothetical protein [Immundisolibacter sp.]